jgi:hypothetical protein
VDDVAGLLQRVAIFKVPFCSSLRVDEDSLVRTRDAIIVNRRRIPFCRLKYLHL